jgi:secondary thiamine-phosphate synthase enzyme
MAQSFTVKTRERTTCVDVTAQVAEIVRASGVQRGLCHVMALHATAAIAINENDDPNIGVDLLTALSRMVPEGPGWLHDRIDDNATAHIKAAILGPQETLAIEEGRLVLGRWQGIMLVELDGPRERRISVQVIARDSG